MLRRADQNAGPFDLETLVRRYGSSVAHVVSDPECAQFRVLGIDGLIPYRRGFRCLVGIGDPISDPAFSDELAEAFRLHCARHGLSTVFAATGARFSAACVARGYAAVEYGEELIFDPRRDPQAGAAGRELRKKINRATRAGVTAREESGDPGARERIGAVAQAWLGARRGPQVFISPILVGDERVRRRWFVAQREAQTVGALSLIRLDTRDGWALEHLMAIPGAPQGTTELLVVRALAALGEEGCGFATFGPSTLSQLGKMVRVGQYGELCARAVFGAAARLFQFDSLARYRRKFQAIASEPSYLLFHPSHFGLHEATGLLRAFNVFRWSNISV
jgi:lysylphosphatidylglycerol synthetase-like protein (DUF2156 family)